MEKSRIIIVGTPSSKTNIIYDILKEYFKSIEYIYFDLDNKINGIKPNFIEIDSITCNSCINCKKKRYDATLKIAGTN